jgi:hypothetical protein
MSRTEEQIEVEKLLSSLESAVAEGSTTWGEIALSVVKVCRLQQVEISESQEIFRNIGFGLRVVASVGAATTALIAAVAGMLDILGFLKK